MIVVGKAYPIARGPESKGSKGKEKKRKCTFIISFSGERDKDGLFTEPDTVDCWLVSAAANELCADKIVDVVLGISGDMVMLREITIGSNHFVIVGNEAESVE